MSFTVDDSKSYKNEKVLAEFTGYLPEQREARCGKSTCFSSVMYGAFIIPEGQIVVRINPAYPMPKQIYLYKN